METTLVTPQQNKHKIKKKVSETMTKTTPKKKKSTLGKLKKVKTKVGTKNYKKISKKSPKKKNKLFKRGVVYVGHVPHGFYEAQMRDYFSQFGKVERLRLSRSKKTARSKGYAFVEFECDEVAKVAAESMNNYLMLEHLIKCEYIPANRVHPDTFKNYGQQLLPYRQRLAARRIHNRIKNEKQTKLSTKSTISKLKHVKKYMSKLGFEFDTSLVINKQKDKSKPYELEVDSSDDEITFKTPPNVVKIKLKSKPTKR